MEKGKGRPRILRNAVSLGLYVTPETASAFKAAAKERKVSVCALFRRVFEEWLAYEARAAEVPSEKQNQVPQQTDVSEPPKQQGLAEFFANTKTEEQKWLLQKQE